MEQILTEQFKSEVLLLLSNHFPTLKIIHISLTGSSGKGLRCPSSDYDVKALTLDSKRQYLLGRVEDSRRFQISYQDTIIEGTAFDIRYAFSKIIKSNPTLFEILKSPVIYQSQFSQQILDFIKQSFNPLVILKAYQGLIYQNLRKFIIKQEKCLVKLGTEQIYLVLQIQALIKNEIPDYGMDDLMKKEAKENYALFEELIQERRKDSKLEVALKPQLIQIMQEVANKEYDMSNMKVKEELELRDIADEIFLSILEREGGE